MKEENKGKSKRPCILSDETMEQIRKSVEIDKQNIKDGLRESARLFYDTKDKCMKVKDLIKMLEKQDQEKFVCCQVGLFEYSPLNDLHDFTVELSPDKKEDVLMLHGVSFNLINYPGRWT